MILQPTRDVHSESSVPLFNASLLGMSLHLQDVGTRGAWRRWMRFAAGIGGNAREREACSVSPMAASRRQIETHSKQLQAGSPIHS